MIYGLLNESQSIIEQQPLLPDDHYALSKVVSEFLINKAAETSGFYSTIFRLPGIYGPGDKGHSTISRLVTSTIQNRSITLHEGGKVMRDFVCVDDIVRIVQAALTERVSGVYNMATGTSHSIKAIAKMIIDKISFPVELIESTSTSNLPRAPGLVFNTTALRSAFPKIQLMQIEEGIVEYLKSELP